MKTLIAFIALAVLGTRSVLNLKEDYSHFALRGQDVRAPTTKPRLSSEVSNMIRRVFNLALIVTLASFRIR